MAAKRRLWASWRCIS